MSRFFIGIDLGTTNSALAYIDRHERLSRGLPVIRCFQIPQILTEGELITLPTLPSFLYFLDEKESDGGRLTLPWHEDSSAVVGYYAREQGALVPGRQVSSAKSWLCNNRVDRTAAILPWDANQGELKCSPVDATTGFLLHLCDAWNHQFASDGLEESHPFENQDIVITVPASFDEEARELTVQAAEAAGIQHLTLLEEPLAAFYAWMVSNKSHLKRILKDSQLVLVCDVGGGTTDFSLIRVTIEDGQIGFSRTAIGEHLLLGGDNLDLALAHLVETKLQHPQLSLRQRKALQRLCCQAKERLLADPAIKGVPIHLPGSGRALVGGTLSTQLTAEDVSNILLNGFLPNTAANDLPKRERRIALRELGLPYTAEPAITKHLAEFLTRNYELERPGSELYENPHSEAQSPDIIESGTSNLKPQTSNLFEPDSLNSPRLACPDAVLFNGGFFSSVPAQEAVVNTLTGWFAATKKGYKVKVLAHADLDRAVSIGAAYYGHVCREGGLRVSGGSGRAYYIGLHQTELVPAGCLQAVCILSRGTEEGTSLELAHLEFKVLANRPVSFSLLSTTIRHDPHGAVVMLDEAEIHRHSPLITVLRYGRRSQMAELSVRLLVKLTELGTLELWCESLTTDHRWRLQFQLRGGEPADVEDEETFEESSTIISGESMEKACELLVAVFGDPHDSLPNDIAGPEPLVGRLEGVLGYGKDAWPTETIRRLCDVLSELSEGRKKRPAYESRWLNLFGYCLRPGFGAVLDDWRIKQARKIYQAGLMFPKDIQCQVEWLVLWGRIAGGLSAGQQLELYQRHLTSLGLGGRKLKGQLPPQVERDGWRMLANLEHLPPKFKVALGEELLPKIQAKPSNQSFLWSLGRIGGRIPLYGHLNCVAPVDAVTGWIEALLTLPELTLEMAAGLVQLGARTDDPVRDIPEDLREQVIKAISPLPGTDHLLERLRRYLPPAPAQKIEMFGESLPEGLRI